MAACLLSAPFLLAVPLVQYAGVALARLGLGSFLLMSLLGPIYSVCQAVARPRMLSFATAIHNLLGIIGGLGMGALLVGMMSDYLTPHYGKEAIRYAMLVPIACVFPAALLYGMAVRVINRDAQRVLDGFGHAAPFGEGAPAL